MATRLTSISARRKGDRNAHSTFYSAWQRHMKRCQDIGIERFTAHDLKAIKVLRILPGR